MSTKFKLHDTVLMRIVQILQEGLLTGTDIADHMRMLELEYNLDVTLIMTEAYKKMVDDNHEKMLEFAEKMQQEQKQ